MQAITHTHIMPACLRCTHTMRPAATDPFSSCAISTYFPEMVAGMLCKCKETSSFAGHGKTLMLYITHILFTIKETGKKKMSLDSRLYISNESWKSRAGSREIERKKKSR